MTNDSPNNPEPDNGENESKDRADVEHEDGESFSLDDILTQENQDTDTEHTFEDGKVSGDENESLSIESDDGPIGSALDTPQFDLLSSTSAPRSETQSSVTHSASNAHPSTGSGIDTYPGPSPAPSPSPGTPDDTDRGHAPDETVSPGTDADSNPTGDFEELFEDEVNDRDVLAEFAAFVAAEPRTVHEVEQEIGKTHDLTRKQVEYRLDKLADSGVIQSKKGPGRTSPRIFWTD